MHIFPSLFPVVLRVCNCDKHIVPDAMHSNCKGTVSIGISTCFDFLLTAFCYHYRQEPDVREQSILANFVLVATLAAV
jgi:hypothetical protein